MGGTDRFDKLLSYYRTTVKTKRWPHTIIFHFQLCCAVNAWILFRIVNKLTRQDDNYSLVSFLENLVDQLCAKRSAVIPTLVEEVPVIFAPKHVAQTQVSRTDSRYFGQHFPFSIPNIDSRTGATNRKQCKRPGCLRKVSTFCKKCGVALCFDLVNGTTCFEQYHTLTH